MIRQAQIPPDAAPPLSGRSAKNSMWRPHILFFAPQILDASSRSGIHRVVTQLARALLPTADVDFVKWDAVDGQLRYFNIHDFDTLFHDWPWRRDIRVNRYAERRGYRFGDTLSVERRAASWLLMPEISHLVANGSAIYARVLAEAQAYRLNTAAVFYDLIPITNPAYSDAAPAHADYVLSLLGVDLIVPISTHSAKELERYEFETFEIDNARRRALAHVITPVPLATVNEGVSNGRSDDHNIRRDHIILLGTVEPRKRQVEVLRAIRKTRILERFDLRMTIIGSLHPLVAQAFNALVGESPRIEYLGYADENKIAELFEQARFSVFASNDEGFGLPICESLARGTPCLAASFGSMREVGEGGGCLLVDVNDEGEIERGLERLASDDALIAELRDEISRRRFRTWDDYASDLQRAMRDYVPFDQTVFRDEVFSAVANGLSSQSGLSVSDVRPGDGDAWTVVVVRKSMCLSEIAEGLSRRNAGRIAIVVDDVSFVPASVAPSDLKIFFSADVWIFRERAFYDSLIVQAEVMSFDGLLPTRCGFADASRTLEDIAADVISGFAGDLFRRRRLARRDSALRKARKATATVGAIPVLDLLISTYNRGPFVAENVRWLLPQVEALNGKVRLLVVDNASTDDTQARLSSFAGAPHFRIVRNAVNTGMLGNLHVCSTLTRARHTWIVGDDDFIAPGMLATVVDALENDPGLPFIFINFGVYIRAALGPHDSAASLIHDPILLAKNPSPTGIYPVKEIAGEHDNLFTAIYPIVFSSDILAACFNYPFTGTPFGSLVESVPTTKIILEDYADVDALWLSEVGIVGNAHNSWQRYRVPWHGVLMPMVFELAKEAGVDPVKLRGWSEVHEGLYREAKVMFPGKTLEDLFGDEIEISRRIFRHSLS